MDYSQLVKDAFWISLRRRYLWFYGVFVGGGGFSVRAPFPGGSGRRSSGAGAGHSLAPGVILAIVVVVLVLFLVFVALSTLSRGALADSVAAEARGERRGFAAAWRSGLAAFWRVLGLGLLVGAIGLAVTLALLVPAVGLVVLVAVLTKGALGPIAAGVAVGIPVAIVLFGLGIIIGVVGQFALRHLVLARDRVFASLAVGWRTVRDNFLPAGAVVLLQYAANFVGSIVVTLVLGVLSLPAFVLVVAGAGVVAIVAALLTGLVVIPLGLTAYGALGTFNHSLWTLSYLRLTGPGLAERPNRS